MNTTEIVVGEMQSDSSFQMREFLAESVRQARKPAKLHSHGQVLPFHKTGRDVLRVRIASSDLGYDLHDFWWGVPRIGAIKLAVVAKQLGELSKVNIKPKSVRNSRGVVVQSVSRDLNAIFDLAVQI